MKIAINNNAYYLTCQCPVCKSTLSRDYQGEIFYCRYCGTKLLALAFSQEEINNAIFEKEMDNYEDL